MYKVNIITNKVNGFLAKDCNDLAECSPSAFASKYITTQAVNAGVWSEVKASMLASRYLNRVNPFAIVSVEKV